jgi:gp32 DNA binding protein like
MAFSKRGKKSGFVYTKRSVESIRRRENQSGSTREGYINREVKIWNAAGGTNKIRILPPTWPDADHFGFDVMVHYQVGVDMNSYICLKQNPLLIEPEECPCCEQKRRFASDGNRESADALTPRKRVLVYIIDRNREHDGVVLWPMPYTFDRDLAAQCHDIDTGEVYAIDDPSEGYDLTFTRDGQGQTTKYRTPFLSKRPKALSEDPDQQEGWLQWITDNPIPDMVIVAEAQAMEEALGTDPEGEAYKQRDDRLRTKGRRGAEDEDVEEEPKVRGSRPRARRVADDDEDEDEPPLTRKRRQVIDDEEEEEEAMRGKPSKKMIARRNDDADEEEEDDEEEAPRGRRSVAPTTRTSKSLRKTTVDDDEEDAEEERPRSRLALAKRSTGRHDLEDDDDEPPRRGKAGDPVSSKLRALHRKRE